MKVVGWRAPECLLCMRLAVWSSSHALALSVQELNGVSCAIEGRLLHARELLRQAAARHGCSFRELLADGASAAFGTGVTCSLNLQQVQLRYSVEVYEG